MQAIPAHDGALNKTSYHPTHVHTDLYLIHVCPVWWHLQLAFFVNSDYAHTLKQFLGTAEMAQRLRVLTALTDIPYLTHSNHMHCPNCM